MRTSRALVVLISLFLPGLVWNCAPAPEEPAEMTTPELEGYWSSDQVDAVLKKTLRLKLAPDLSVLSTNEKEALEKLLAVGAIFQKLYEQSRHHQALDAGLRLQELHQEYEGSVRTQRLLDLYRLFQGPIATTLDNERVPFLPVDGKVPGKNVYPWGVTRENFDLFLEAHPEQRTAILHLRSVVRRGEPENLAEDLELLRRHPALGLLHPGLVERLEGFSAGHAHADFYAVPYSVAYAEELLESYRLLGEAADLIQESDRDFAQYLRLRSRDLLTDDYEAGDAAWVNSRFGRLNAQIGSYEVYDDELYGTKSFFSLGLLLRDEARSRELVRALKDIQSIQDSLPQEATKRVREDIPVGVYDVIADFGQARGTNTATILPNESDHARKYGRTILIRANILRNPELFAISKDAFTAAVAPEHAGDLTQEGKFQRTLWHEIGHYLGPDRTRDGRELDLALEEYSSLLEEMKADLVSLFAAPALHRSGYLDDVGLRAIYASGVNRTLQSVRPRREQPYQTMQLMQMNYFLEKGLLTFNEGRLEINYAVYHNVVTSLLEEVLDIQSEGNPTRAAGFVDKYASWEEEEHGALASRIRDSIEYRFRLVRYAALGE